MTRYATPTEFRNVTNIGTDEYSDTQLEQVLDVATRIIDRDTNRTWQGVQTVTDELYDGNNEIFLYLLKGDIGSVTALSVDEDLDGTWTSVDTSDIIVYEEIGKIVLDVERDSDIAVDYFTKGNETVKVSYTWGNASPTDDVKQLCIDVALEYISPNPERAQKIKNQMNMLKANSIDIV